MAGLRRCQRRGNRLQVTHLSHQDHIGVFPESRPQCLGVVLGITADLPLVDDGLLVSVQILDGIFQRDDVIRIIPVDDVHQGSQRGRLAASGGPGHENQPPPLLRQPLYLGRNVQAVRVRDRKRQTAHGRRVRSPLPENVHTKPTDARNGVGQVCLSGLSQLLPVCLVQNAKEQIAQLPGHQRFLRRRGKHTVNPVIGRASHTEMNVGSACGYRLFQNII